MTIIILTSYFFPKHVASEKQPPKNMNGTSMQRFKRIIFHFSKVPDITEQPLTQPQTQLKPVTNLDPLLIQLHGLNLMPESRSINKGLQL